MVYKLCNICDMASLPSMSQNAWNNIFEFVKVLTFEYGSDRNIDHDDGGYVLYCPEGTSCEEIKDYFDYSKNTVEYVNRSGDICCAMYLLNNDYAVTIIISTADAPNEITEAFEEGY